MNGKRSRAFAMICLVCSLLTGCSDAVVEEEKLILVEKEAEAITYEMTVASVSDVIKTQKVRCVYQQVNDESVSFTVSGKRIVEVCVELGDHVKKGQLLARLDTGNAEEQIRTLEYNIARNQEILSNLKLNEDYEISTLWLNYLYRSGETSAEKKALEERVKMIQQNYRYTREDCEDALALDQAQLEKLQKDLKHSCIYAGLDGVISYLKVGLEGASSAKGEEIMKIIDSSECLFAVADTSLAPCFQEGVEVDMNIVSGAGAGNHKLLPYEIEKWEEELLFTLNDETDGTNIEVGTQGTIRFVLDQRSQVLTLPLQAVHEADGKHFVYVLGENNMRQVVWIETGLFGDNLVEIVSGLTEGEKVIIQ
ncbi:MAG: biotin/lipoyl-binding protein [Lachnospiraceae bacterium]|nr:biotin/lipoyl-binding protein [Lachnospiraceae bacterium]